MATLLRVLSTTSLLIGIVGVIFRNSDADVISALAWITIFFSFSAHLFCGLLYLLFFRDS